jgi:hypothetical protein
MGASLPSVPLALPTTSYVSKSGQVADSRIINGYLEVTEGGKSDFAIWAQPGLTRWNSGAYAGLERGLHVPYSSRLLTLFGQQLVAYDATGKDRLLGSVTGAGRVTMATNLNATPQTAIVTAEKDFYLLSGDTLTLPADPDLPAPNSVCYVKGAFVFGIDDGRMFASDVNAAGVSAASYGSAFSKNDPIKRVVEFAGLLYVLKGKSSEIWQADPNLASSPFFFSPAQQDIDFGLGAFHSVANFGGNLVWVDHNGVVRMGRDQAASIISNNYVERLLSELSADELAETVGSVSSFEGNQFYTLRSPKWCLQYDPAGKPSWYERRTEQSSTWRATHSVPFAGMHIFGSADAGALYALDPASYRDGGAPLYLEVWVPHLHKFPSWLSVACLQIDAVTGVGLKPGDDADVNPVLLIDYSDDGGRNFKGERRVPLGKMGEYAQSIERYKWGTIRGKGRIWRFRASPAVMKCIQSAAVMGKEVRAWQG